MVRVPSRESVCKREGGREGGGKGGREGEREGWWVGGCREDVCVKENLKK